jgi:hypothetical protein
LEIPFLEVHFTFPLSISLCLQNMQFFIWIRYLGI